ncbi:MAG TPA: cytochrome d ubiquinol oxidase subunit II [Thermodesulfobacteriota bacterium]
MEEFTTLQAIWFGLITVLWIGYFVLEGFDFGVGMLLRRLGRDKTERRMLLHTIGPVWDGNEVWLLVAGGATFAAFPHWYATLFSGFYVALFLILAALIVRGVAFEFWGKVDSDRWRATWEWAIVAGSAVPALLWGVAWANIVRGVPIDANMEVTGNLLDLLNPYALLGGVTTLLVFLAHGAIFVSLRTRGDMERRARRLAGRLAPGAAIAAAGFLVWTLGNQADRGGIEAVSLIAALLAAAGAISVVASAAKKPGLAFGLSAGTIAAFVVALVADLFPNVMVSTTSPEFSITLNEAASTPYTLKVMTIVAVVFVPIVLAYTAWTYWVFRARLGREDFEEVKAKVAAVAKRSFLAERRGGEGGETAPTA